SGRAADRRGGDAPMGSSLAARPRGRGARAAPRLPEYHLRPPHRPQHHRPGRRRLPGCPQLPPPPRAHLPPPGAPHPRNPPPAPANLVFARCHIHGTPTGSLRNGVIINSASTAILDSWVSDVHELSNEAHGILGNSGPGPFKIVNNEVQAAGENVMFSQDSSNGVIPSDIEIRGNHLFKPTSWYYPNNPNAGLTTWS